MFSYTVKASTATHLGDFGVNLKKGESIDIAGEGYSARDIADSMELAQALEDEKIELVLDPDQLRIFYFIRADQNPKHVDFSIIGLRKKPPKYTQGRKYLATYTDEADRPVVEKEFFDVHDPETGRLMAIYIKFSWFREDGDVGLTKTEVAREFDKYEAETLLYKRRQDQVNFMKAGARDTPLEAYLNLLLSNYENELWRYVENASPEIYDAIIGETDPQLVAILNTQFVSSFGLLTVRQSVLHQLQYVPPEAPATNSDEAAE